MEKDCTEKKEPLKAWLYYIDTTGRRVPRLYLMGTDPAYGFEFLFDTSSKDNELILDFNVANIKNKSDYVIGKLGGQHNRIVNIEKIIKATGKIKYVHDNSDECNLLMVNEIKSGVYSIQLKEYDENAE